MGIDTRLFEIDPRSEVFALLRSDGELAQSLYLLKWRYIYPDMFEGERKLTEEYGGLLEAIDRMVDDEPDFANRWIDLGKTPGPFQVAMELVAEETGKSTLARAVFEGERELAPGPYVPACWIDGGRCREIADWLDTITPERLDAAARELARRDPRRYEPAPDRKEAVRESRHERLRQFRALFEGAARRGNVVVVLIQ